MTAITGASVVTPSDPLSMEEYIKRIPGDKQDVAISDEDEIARIAKKIQSWEYIAPFLKLKPPQVQTIKKNHMDFEEQKLAVRPL